MFGVLRFAATATLADVVRGIHRTPAQRIALVFPLGAHVSLAEIGRMGVVDLLCQEQRKEATIVGGDAELRACAVACGLRAAVTVEDWRAMRIPRSTWISWRKAQPTISVKMMVLPNVTALLPSDTAQGTSLAPHSGELAEDDAEDDADPCDDLPERIRELLTLQGREPSAESPQRRPHMLTAPRRTTIAYDLDRDDDLRDLWESDEERLTQTIRSSSGLSRTILESQWHMTQVTVPSGAGS